MLVYQTRGKPCVSKQDESSLRRQITTAAQAHCCLINTDSIKQAGHFFFLLWADLKSVLKFLLIQLEVLDLICVCLIFPILLIPIFWKTALNPLTDELGLWFQELYFVSYHSPKGESWRPSEESADTTIKELDLLKKLCNSFYLTLWLTTFVWDTVSQWMCVNVSVSLSLDNRYQSKHQESVW